MIEHYVGRSRRAAVVHATSRLVMRPVLAYYPLRGPLARTMPLVDRTCGLLPRLGGTTHREVAGRHWRAELVTPYDGPTSSGAILYLHGGAFLTCGLGTHRRIVERLARRTGMSVLALDYRQLPAGTLECSLADTLDAFRWLVGHGHPAHRIVLAGDSAGGHLAFAAALRMRDLRRPMPAAIVGMSPWLDFDHRGKLLHANVRRDAYIPARRLRRVGAMAVGVRPDVHHSPVNADLRGLPPCLLICSDSEVLRVDAELMTERLAQAGVEVTLQLWEGQVHAFPVLADLVPESMAALEAVSSFAERAVAAAGRVTRGRGESARAARVAGAGVA